jgi:hypothetical protein
VRRWARNRALKGVADSAVTDAGTGTYGKADTGVYGKNEHTLVNVMLCA